MSLLTIYARLNIYVETSCGFWNEDKACSAILRLNKLKCIREAIWLCLL